MSATGRFDHLFASNARSYHKLPGLRSMRLIKIKQSKDEEPLSCDLHIVSDHKVCPAYSALSYCWGDDPVFRTIKVNGEELLVTADLYVALKRLRTKSESKWVWVDAICINQHDRLERNQQVKNMREVYERADKVIVWLGPEDEHSLNAFSLIQQITSKCVAEFLGCEPLTDWPDQFRDEPQRQALEKFSSDWIGLELPAPSSKVWYSLTQFYARPWFERVWVIQEICVAPDAVVFCGSLELPWQMVGLAGHWLAVAEGARHIRNSLRQSLSDTTPPLGPSNALFLSRKGQTIHHFSPFLHVLDRSLQFKATEPRDKIFALLHYPAWSRRKDSKACETVNEVITPHLDVEVDYSSSLSELNREIALRSICQHQNLEALNYAWRIRIPGSTGPSWIAEWHAELKDRRPQLIPHIFDAAGSTTPQVMSSDTLNELVLRGIIVDQVTELHPTIDLTSWLTPGGTISETSQVLDELRSLCVLLTQDTVVHEDKITVRRPSKEKEIQNQCLRSFCAYLSGLYVDTETQGNFISLSAHKCWCDVCMTPMAKARTISRPRGYICQQCRQGNFDLCESCFNAGKWCPCSDHVITPSTFPSLLLDTANQKVFNLLRAVAGQETTNFFRYRSSNVAFNRRTLFITQSGRYGLCPRRVRSGDLVVILFGRRTPFILRKTTNGRHQLVSDCYLHGAMDGELTSERDLQDDRSVVFTLI